MKKFLQILVAAVAVVSFGLAPVVVQAQTVEEIDDPTTTLPSTGGSEVAAPDTGIAPTNNVVRNTAVFIGGSLLGAGIGLGFVAMKKKKLEQ